jgi:hypothetical protein
MVAAEAGVHRTSVCHWLRGKFPSRPIQSACDRLIAREIERAEAIVRAS